MLPEVIDKNKLKRKPDVIKKLFSNKGDSIIANDDFYIVFPERFINKRLAVTGSVVKVVAIYSIIDDKLNYGVISAPVFIEITPTMITHTIIDGVPQTVLEIAKGSVFVANRNLLQQETFMYDLFDEFFLQGRVPWYITYEQLSKMFIEASKYANSRIGDKPLAMEIITSIIARSPKNKKVNLREVISSNTNTAEPKYVGLTNVYYSYDNTLSKIMGGYMQQGVTTAVVDKETKTTKVSALLRA